ncbi:MAG TPA: HDOD domain-containing protein [candidate division Zixibacteria bacterium]|nr:HDOD domain-containing protein [candidate division Zixibacteria bacterium]
MDKIALLEQIQKNHNLLSLPQVLSEILQEVGKENFAPEALARIILKDPSLTSRILSMSNSAFYQRYTEIKTVHQAISMLGVTTVKCLALSSSIFHPDKIADESGVDAKEFFGYVLSVAAACKKIAQITSFPSPEEAFIAGLLNDVGLMFMLHHHPKEYRKVLSGEVQAESLVEAEIKTFGIDHSEIGFHLAELWKIPTEIRNAIAGHHKTSPDKNSSALKGIVRLAVALTRERFSGFEVRLEDRLNQIAVSSRQLSLSKQQVDEISSSLLTETFEIAEYLGVDIGNIEEMLTTANQEIWKAYLIIENLFKERQELTKSLLEEERAKGAVESKNIAMATLSHYLNNAVMGIYGRSQIVEMMLKKGDNDRVIREMPETLGRIEQSVKKIVAVIEEMKQVSPIDQKKFDKMSKALNIDDLIEKRLAAMNAQKRWDEPVPSS